MTKKEALEKTTRRFTNLMDGKVFPNIGVWTIIEYYEGLIKDELIEIKTTSNIMQNFIEDDIDELREEDYWDGDASHSE